MRTKFGILLFVCACCYLYAPSVRAQNVGVGTVSPDASALVDMTSTSLGLLIPRMTNANMLAITSPANGLLVFNSTAANNTFYYNSGTSGAPVWVPFLSSLTGWSLTGNAGTTPGTNFLGTTDAQAVVFKTNGTERMRILSTGNIGIGTTAAAGYLDVAPTITAVAAATNYNTRQDPTLSGSIALAQTALYNNYNLPTINLTGGVSNTLTTLYNNYSGLTATAGTIGTYYGNYIAAPTGAGTVSTKYALVTEATAGNVGIGTTAPASKLEVSNGDMSITNNNNAAGQIKLYEPSTSGANYSSFQAGVQAGDITYTLPTTAPTANQFLVAGSTTATALQWSTSPLGVATILRKTSSTTATASTTLTDDPTLAYAVAASSAYQFDAFLHLTAASGTGDFEFQFTGPAGATIVAEYYAKFTAAPSSATQSEDILAFTSANGTKIKVGGQANNSQFVHITGMIITGVTAGTVHLQWSQFTASGATTMTTNSWIRFVQTN